MNAVTCQASGERQRLATADSRACPEDSGSRPSLRSRGAQATAARRAGAAQSARGACQPDPSRPVRGTLAPAATAALVPKATEYAPVTAPARSGKSRLTRPGRSTLPTAIAAPRTAVPANSDAAPEPAERSRMPPQSTSMLPRSALSAPNRRARRGAAGESAARSEEHTSELQSRQYLVCRL